MTKRRPMSLADVLSAIKDGPQAVPSVYRGIEMRSILETRFAAHLDALGEEWVYEPAIYGPAGKGYLPDFEIVSAHRRTFVEVKPTLPEVTPAQVKMSIIWDTHPEALLIVACWEPLTFTAAYRGTSWESWGQRWSA